MDGPPAGGRVEVVLLDAFGTLLDLEAPAPRLRRLLQEAGHEHPEHRVAEALRAEILYYRREHDRGSDPTSLVGLRRDCARIVAGRLGRDVPPLDRLAELLVESLRFRLFPDALPALDALAGRDVRLAVVSNWDCSLPDELTALGVAGRFATIAVSAVVGARKPDPRIFRHALERLGVPADRALHCGDQPRADCAGARAAGIPAVLVDRKGVLPAGACPRVGALTDLPALISRSWPAQGSVRA